MPILYLYFINVKHAKHDIKNANDWQQRQRQIKIFITMTVVLYYDILVSLRVSHFLRHQMV